MKAKILLTRLHTQMCLMANVLKVRGVKKETE